ncbi:glycosylinositol phosphorylceramide mannosyl transferase 1 [Lolium perenne]|uniref:glycosylinositol phosphorylceramide mannosyl transferase 1 n=1 Tax=Lolium perenne TaxID=4522 RepID=UPI0021F5B057|nr:glycosylinositol phosphorylceramide mannosyl transferase 1 [Lolium perenne]
MPMLPGMAKLLLQLKAAAVSAYRRNGNRRRHPVSPLPSRHPSGAGAGRLGPCFVAGLLALAAAATLTLGLALHRADPDADAPASSRGAGDGSGYAVVINTWKRYDLMKRAVAHYSGCAGVDAVHVVWSEPQDPPEALRQSVLNCSRLLRDGGAAEVRFVVNKQDSLNNRFRPIPELRTDAVFSVDDDLIVPCSTLRFAFNVWRSAPSAMVGFVPRIHWLADPGSNTKEYRYASWWSVWRTGTYSMVLSKASFFHRKYLDLYTNQMPPSIRDYVTKNRNCEDIAMSFLVANVTGAPPIWVKGRIFEIGSTGISSSKGHILQRSRCLSEFSSMYGHMPLVATTVKAVDGRSSWLW